MNATAKKLLFLGLVGTMVGLAYGLEYISLTNSEESTFGDRFIYQVSDTVDGPMRANSQIAIVGDPVFTDLVITTAPDFWRGSGYNPHFIGPFPVFNARPVAMPTTLTEVRSMGSHVAAGPYQQMRLHFHDGSITFYRWDRGTPFDSTDRWTVVTGYDQIFFCDCPIQVYGIVSGSVMVGCSSDIVIIDDIRYADADPLTGVTPSSSNNFLTLASEHDIKIGNTVANGRENSSGQGYNQHDRNLTSVVITAAVYAMGGSFTFEQQNDPDSGYVCQCQPDDRGTVYLYGGVVQQRRGYLHRSNRGSTGYTRHIRYDRRLRYMADHVMNVPGIVQAPDSVNFGNVPEGTTGRDTVRILTLEGVLSTVHATPPFQSGHADTTFGSEFHIPVSFTPTQSRSYTGILDIGTTFSHIQIILTGRGVHPEAVGERRGIEPAAFSLSAFPNPFNATTEFRYTIPSTQHAMVTVFDLSGRVVQEFDLGDQTAGEHSVPFNGNGLSSGVYFARLSAGTNQVTSKLLLLK